MADSMPVTTLRFLLLCACLGLLASCTPQLSKQIELASEDARAVLDENLNGDETSRPLVQRHEMPYLNTRRVAYEGTAWLHEWVDMRVAELPMNVGLTKALEQLSNPPSVVFTSDLIYPELPVTLTHRGPFRDFLNMLAEASGYGWEQKGGTLYWMAEITRTFDIHRVPGDFSFSLETQETPSSTVQSGGGDGVDAGLDAGGDISIDGGGTFWDDLEASIGSLAAAGSVYTIDRSTGTVVVRGPAGEVRHIGRYIDALNRWLERQVLLEIQMVQVTLSDERQLGIDWNLVRDVATSTRPVDIVGSFGAEDIGGGVLTGRLGAQSRSIFQHTDTKVVIAALEDQGETSVQNSPRIVAMNGQAAQLQVQDDRTIVASRSTTTTGTAGTTEAAVTPGTVSTGITVTILPKIVGEQVLLQANIQISSLVNLLEGGGEDGITLPHVQSNQFFQSARLRSGETLALSGLISREGRDTGRHLPGAPLLGKTTQKFSRVETVLLITPTLLDPPAPDEALLQ